MSLFSNPAFLWAVGGSIVGQLALIYWKPLQETFQTEALSPGDMLYIVSLSSMVLWLDTLRKKTCPKLFSDGYHASPRAAITRRRKHRGGRGGAGVKKASSWLNFGRATDISKASQAGITSRWTGGNKKAKAKTLLAL